MDTKNHQEHDVIRIVNIHTGHSVNSTIMCPEQRIIKISLENVKEARKRIKGKVSVVSGGNINAEKLIRILSWTMA